MEDKAKDTEMLKDRIEPPDRIGDQHDLLLLWQFQQLAAGNVLPNVQFRSPC